jgi:hypothetical protein
MRHLSSAYVPARIFLDQNTQQALVDHSGAVFEHEDFVLHGRSGATEQDVVALNGIFRVATRAHFEFVVSENSMREAARARDVSYAGYAVEVAAHFSDAIAFSPEPFDGSGADRVCPLDDGRCGYLSPDDARLIRDAVLLECDTFLTIEKKLPRNAEHLSRELGLEVLRPPELWEYFQPHLAAL